MELNTWYLHFHGLVSMEAVMSASNSQTRILYTQVGMSNGCRVAQPLCILVYKYVRTGWQVNREVKQLK